MKNKFISLMDWKENPHLFTYQTSAEQKELGTNLVGCGL